MDTEYREDRVLPRGQVIDLYRANGWSAADKPDELMKALAGSDYVVSAWDGDILAALGNAITDGALIVYYPHLLVHPDYKRKGIGRAIMERMTKHYRHMHQQVVIAEDPDAASFYRTIGLKEMPGSSAMALY